MTTPPCRDNPDLHFDEGNEGRVARAKKVCAGCPLRLGTACLEDALHHDVVGVWAATTTRERNAIRTRTGIVAVQIVTNPYPYRRAVA